MKIGFPLCLHSGWLRLIGNQHAWSSAYAWDVPRGMPWHHLMTLGNRLAFGRKKKNSADPRANHHQPQEPSKGLTTSVSWKRKLVFVFPMALCFVIKVYFYIPWGIGLLMFLRNISLNRNAYYFLSIPRASLDPRADARGLCLGVLLLGKTYIVRSCFISFWRCDAMTFNGFHAKALRVRLRRALVCSYGRALI